MTTSFTLREMTPADSAAIAVLSAQSPDGGMVTFSPRFHAPAYEVYAARHGDFAGVVVEVPGAEGLVGAAHVSFGECQFEGSVRPYALLSSLVVHPDYRRKGIATALAQWRIAHAVKRSGEDTIIFANIQAGNVGSTANAKKWISQIGGRVVTQPVQMRTKPPTPNPAITIREATTDDLVTIAQMQNAFYRGYNFYRPQTAERLQKWLGEIHLAKLVNHYVVAVDRRNRIVAGVGVTNEGRLMSTYVEKMPLMLQLVNLALKLIPSDRELRSLEIHDLWFAEAELEAARTLWQTLRWEWRELGNSMVYHFDPRSPITDVLQVPSWMPSTSLSIAMRTPVPMDETKLIAPML